MALAKESGSNYTTKSRYEIRAEIEDKKRELLEFVIKSHNSLQQFKSFEGSALKDPSITNETRTEKLKQSKEFYHEFQKAENHIEEIMAKIAILCEEKDRRLGRNDRL